MFVDRFMQAYYKRFINGEIVLCISSKTIWHQLGLRVECLVDETKPANTLNTVITIHTVYVDGNYTLIFVLVGLMALTGLILKLV